MPIINFSKDFVEEECCVCGVSFYISSKLISSLKKTKRDFYCPNGHCQSYIKSTEEILKETIQVKENKIRELENIINKKKRK